MKALMLIFGAGSAACYAAACLSPDAEKGNWITTAFMLLMAVAFTALLRR